MEEKVNTLKATNVSAEAELNQLKKGSKELNKKLRYNETRARLKEESFEELKEKHKG